MRSGILRLALAIALAATLRVPSLKGDSPPAAGGENLGRIEFPTSATGPAQERFVRGVLLLHSFMYDEAADEFEAAQKADPGFALAYWGEAMTKNHPLWMQRDAAEARKILERLAPTREARLAKAASARERGYLNAVEELYAEGEKRDRDRAYAEAMGRLHEEFPEDLEAQSFYALALLGSCEDHRDFAVYMKGAALAEEVFARNPMHPGAVHYLIHAYDDPVHAPLGLRPARVYARIAGSAAHALHMPSHIFLALGMWDDAIESNEASWKASEERVALRHLGADERGWHGIFWREYALLQEGRVREARALLLVAEADAKQGLSRVEGARSEMRAAFAIETGCAGWTAPSDAPAKPRDHFVRGYCSWRKGNTAGLKAAIVGLAKTSADKPADAASSGAHMHGQASASPNGGAPAAYGYGTSGGSLSDVFRIQLEALELSRRGDSPGAIARARQAAAAEDAMTFEFGPPAVVKPSHELLGEILLDAKKPADAAVEFDAALARAPGRAVSLFGRMRAAHETGDRANLDASTKIWIQNHRKSDDRRDGSASPRSGEPR